MTARILLDTREHSDAILCGYDGPRDPNETDEGLILTYYPPTETNPGLVDLQGPEGTVTLLGPEVLQVARALHVANNRGTRPLNSTEPLL